MSEATPPPVPPIEDRRMILAIADAAEGIAALALAALAASEQVRTDRMGSARVQLDHAVRRLDQLFGNTLNGAAAMTPVEWEGHAVRLSGSAGRLADIIGSQALSLARFPRDRLSVEMVAYDLLAQTVFVTVMGLVDQQPAAADTLIDQLAAELHVMVEEWRERRDAEEDA